MKTQSIEEGNKLEDKINKLVGILTSRAFHRGVGSASAASPVYAGEILQDLNSKAVQELMELMEGSDKGNVSIPPHAVGKAPRNYAFSKCRCCPTWS